MSEELFKFGIDNPSKITKYTKRFVDLEGFLDENYEGEHHNVWDNKDECWLHLDDALCLMEKEYCTIKSENKQLRQKVKRLQEIAKRTEAEKEEYADLYNECRRLKLSDEAIRQAYSDLNRREREKHSQGNATYTRKSDFEVMY